MSYTGRMVLRMYLPCVAVFVASGAAAMAANLVQDLPGQVGMAALYSHLPRWLFGMGVSLAVVLAAVQAFRLRGWERGVLASCYVCGCLLGTPRSAHRGLGRTRHCLGCGKVHGVNHRLVPHLLPLAVAVEDTAKGPVSVRSSP